MQGEINHDETRKAVQMKTAMHGHEDSISATNRIQSLVTSALADPVQSAYNVGYGYVCGNIGKALLGLSLRHNTMNKIWRCIMQVEGYKANSWKAVLVKLDIPEEHHGDVITIMADATRSH
jgi:hypothetical protein